MSDEHPPDGTPENPPPAPPPSLEIKLDHTSVVNERTGAASSPEEAIAELRQL